MKILVKLIPCLGKSFLVELLQLGTIATTDTMSPSSASMCVHCERLS